MSVTAPPGRVDVWQGGCLRDRRGRPNRYRRGRSPLVRFGGQHAMAFADGGPSGLVVADKIDHRIDTSGERLSVKLVDIVSGRDGEELGSTHAKGGCAPFGLVEGFVGYRDRRLHKASITGYDRCTSGGRLPPKRRWRPRRNDPRASVADRAGTYRCMS